MILNETASKYNILLLQEPWIGDIGGGNRGPPAHSTWQPFIPIQTIHKDDCPKVLIYIRHNRPDLKVMMHSDLALDLDFQILEIMRKPHPPMFILNLYNGKDTNNISTIVNPSPTTTKAIYTGDWTLHHVNWSLDGTTRGQATHHNNWIDNNNLMLINTPGVPTWQSTSGQQSIIDLTFANMTVSNNSTIRNW
jgi:hypothetical protein